jgi:hypothetical protein
MLSDASRNRYRVTAEKSFGTSFTPGPGDRRVRKSRSQTAVAGQRPGVVGVRQVSHSPVLQTVDSGTVRTEWRFHRNSGQNPSQNRSDAIDVLKMHCETFSSMATAERSNFVAYTRVSTDAQDARLQRDALAEAGCGRVFEDKISSRKADRPGLAAALDYLRAGDTLCV